MIYRLPKKFPLLHRKPNTDKSHYGHALLLAGSPGMSGAAVLAASAALRSGSGLVTLGLPAGLSDSGLKTPPEVMRKRFAGTKTHAFSPRAVREVLRFAAKRRINAVVVGPGIGLHQETQRFVRDTVLRLAPPLVLDADGLNSFKGKAAILKKRKGALILTPHAAEFERLFDERVPASESRRTALAKKMATFYHVVLVLKGHRTLVVSKDRVYVNRSGNAAMAKGGSGDVLTGLIASFIAQGLDPYEASVWAVYIHGRSGDLAVKKTGELGLTASDMIHFFPKVFSSLR